MNKYERLLNFIYNPETRSGLIHMNLVIIHTGFILIPLGSNQYYDGSGRTGRTWRVWYVFGIRVIWYDTTKA